MSGAGEQKLVVITGAASGIGRATALAFADKGAILELGDVDANGLAQTRRLVRALGADAVTTVVDVSEAEAMLAWAAAVEARNGAADVLVNNAGVGIGGPFLSTDLASWRWALGVNLDGVIHGCHAFLPAMVARNTGGHIVNLASLAGLVGLPGMSSYSTTKFAVVGLSESLRAELAPHRIGVSVVCPGIIDTPITRNMRVLGGDEATQRRRAARVYRLRRRGPERVAQAIVSAVERNRAVVPVNGEAWFAWLGKRVAPGLIGRLARVDLRALAGRFGR